MVAFTTEPIAIRKKLKKAKTNGIQVLACAGLTYICSRMSLTLDILLGLCDYFNVKELKKTLSLSLMETEGTSYVDIFQKPTNSLQIIQAERWLNVCVNSSPLWS